MVNREGGKYWRLQLHWPATAKSSISCVKFDPTDSHNVCSIFLLKVGYWSDFIRSTQARMTALYEAFHSHLAFHVKSTRLARVSLLPASTLHPLATKRGSRMARGARHT